MIRRYSSWRSSRPPSWRNLSEGQSVAGFPVGILCIPGVSGLIPGNVQNAQTFDFPVIYHVMRDVRFEQIARGDRAVVPVITAAARSLAEDGVGAIVGACGSLGHYQSIVADAVGVPVFMSVLLQVPLVLKSLGSDKKLAILFADKTAFTPLIRVECGIVDVERLLTIDLTDSPAFAALSHSDEVYDGNTLLQQMMDKLRRCLDPSVGAILLQCSDLPPFAAEIQAQFGVPVFDMTGLIEWVHYSLVRGPYAGLY